MFKDLYEIFLNQDKIQFIKIIILLFFGAILEMIGLAAIIPFFSLFKETELDKLNSYNFLSLEIEDFKSLIFLGFISLLVLKTLFLSYLIYSQQKFLKFFKARITSRLFKNYLEISLSSFENLTSGEYIRNLVTETGNLNTFIHSITVVLIESVLSISVVLTLLFLRPFETITSFIFILFFSLMFYLLIKKKIIIWGNERLSLLERSNNIMIESFKGIIEVKFYNLLKFFSSHLDRNVNRIALIDVRRSFFSEVFKHYIELICVVGIFLYYFFTKEFKNEIQIFQDLSLFALALFRILPSANRIMGMYQNISFFKPALSIIKKELNLKKENKTKFEGKLFNQLIDINISFQYSNSERPLFKDLQIKIKKNDILGIYGDSGSGKSTLIKIISGLYSNYDGTILIDNKDLKLVNSQWKQKISYVPQDSFFISGTILENIILDKDYNYQKLNSLIELLSFKSFIKSFHQSLDYQVGENGNNLSGGQKQKISFLRALYMEPEILILDEPTASLDSNASKDILKALNLLKGNITLLIVSHKREVIEICNNKVKLETYQSDFK